MLGGGSPPNSLSRSKGQAQNSGLSGRVTEPKGFDTDKAPTMLPSSSMSETEPIPPLSVPAFAPIPAPKFP